MRACVCVCVCVCVCCERESEREGEKENGRVIFITCATYGMEEFKNSLDAREKKCSLSEISKNILFEFSVKKYFELEVRTSLIVN